VSCGSSSRDREIKADSVAVSGSIANKGAKQCFYNTSKVRPPPSELVRCLAPADITGSIERIGAVVGDGMGRDGRLGELDCLSAGVQGAELICDRSTVYHQDRSTQT
jgi:hypothetical protein